MSLTVGLRVTILTNDVEVMHRNIQGETGTIKNIYHSPTDPYPVEIKLDRDGWEVFTAASEVEPIAPKE